MFVDFFFEFLSLVGQGVPIECDYRKSVEENMYASGRLTHIFIC